MNVRDSHACSLSLCGVDGTNPLGFLAALGTLVVARQASEVAARLRWVRARTWTPVLDGLTTNEKERFCERLATALQGKTVSPEAEKRSKAAEKAYAEASNEVKKETEKIKKEKIKSKEDRKKAHEERIRPLEEIADAKRAEWLAVLKDAVPRAELALGVRIDCSASEFRRHTSGFDRENAEADREAIQYLAAFGSDACLEGEAGSLEKRSIEATPFSFINGSGNQNFLDTACCLHAKISVERLCQTLFEPWDYRDKGLSMRWDPIEDKRYALMDTKPADEGVSTVWMANLLAYRALALFPCAPTRQGLGTTGWTHVEEQQAFTWPVWELAAGPDTVGTMLQLRELRDARPDRAVLDKRGVAAVFRARCIRVPPEGANYKLNFSPARQLL